MKKYIVVLVLFTLSFGLCASNHLDSLLQVLDQTVKLRDVYAHEKEQNILRLKEQLGQTSHNEQKFSISRQLFGQYKNYQMDSAYHIAEQRLALAKETGKAELLSESYMNLAEILRTTGMYKETLDILKSIADQGLDVHDKAYYYHLYHSLYMLMGDYSISESERKLYKSQVFSYKDSLLQILTTDNISHYLVRSSREIMLGEYDKALQIVKEGNEKFDIDKAHIDYTFSEIYRYKGDTDQEMIYLAMSSIADLRAGVKEYISLRKLAILLYQSGDIDRAYLYMKSSMEDAIFCNARLRTLEVSQMLPMINATYDIKMSRERDRLFTLLAITIILSIVLAVMVGYIYKQVKTLSSIRKYQKKMNLELKAMNENLNRANAQLSEANLVKEEYIGYVFNICSSYIDKLEDFRLSVNRKIKAGLVDEVLKMTKSTSLVATELKEFYKNFDSIFLNLYPTFVRDFNALLAEGEKIYPKEGDLLTPELRIYALVRLGINDSVKIADFLHYSPQTVYNYRMKVRNKSTVPKGSLSEKVAEIGIERPA